MRQDGGESNERDVPAPGSPLDTAEGCLNGAVIAIVLWLIAVGIVATWIWWLS